MDFGSFKLSMIVELTEVNPLLMKNLNTIPLFSSTITQMWLWVRSKNNGIRDSLKPLNTSFPRDTPRQNFTPPLGATDHNKGGNI